MKKVLGRAVLVLLMSPLLHAGPLTPADLALFDASPEDLHAAAVAMRAAGYTSLKQIATQGIGDNIVPYLNNTSGQSYTNTTALQTIMGDWSATPKTYGVLGEFIPENVADRDSLYHRITDRSSALWEFSEGPPFSPTALSLRGLLGTLDSVDFQYFPSIDNVSGLLNKIMFLIGGNSSSFSWGGAWSICDAICYFIGGGIQDGFEDAYDGVIGDYTTGITHSDYHFGILGALADPVAGKGVWGDIGGTEDTIKGRLAELVGALETKVTSDGKYTVPEKSPTQSIIDWIDTWTAT